MPLWMPIWWLGYLGRIFIGLLSPFAPPPQSLSPIDDPAMTPWIESGEWALIFDPQRRQSATPISPISVGRAATNPESPGKSGKSAFAVVASGSFKSRKLFMTMLRDYEKAPAQCMSIEQPVGRCF